MKDLETMRIESEIFKNEEVGKLAHLIRTILIIFFIIQIIGLSTLLIYVLKLIGVI